jgi:membrane protease YdiL (CAAX protease family)
MSDEPESLPAAPTELAPPLPEREPFWGYADLALFFGLAFPCLLMSLGIVKGAMALFHIQDPLKAGEALAEQLIFYVLLFLALRMVFLVQYGRPFWQSLGWRPTRLPVLTLVMLGIGTALTVAITSALLHTPDTANPMTEMMRDRTSLILMAIFGTTLAPLCEELAFRGFLQPLLVRSLGAAAGILLAAAPFGLLHYWQYGNSWRHAVVIAVAGLAFGTVRQLTGSTKAAVIMHSAYNGFLFLALFSVRKDIPHLW